MRHRSQLDRFVAAVHRRAVGVRVVEYAGLGLLVAAGFVLILGLAMQRFDRLPVLVFAAGSAGLGMLVGFQRRPTPLDAVVEADRQLRLDDLLSSAITAGDDAFGRAVRATAERACERLSPSAVVVNRLGGRAWGGIGLAWAIVLVLSLLTGGPIDSRAGDEPTQALPSLLRDRLTGQPPVKSDARHLPGPGSGVDEPRPFGDTPGQPGPTRQPGSATPSDTPGQASSGAGPGAARTEDTRIAPPGTGGTTPGTPGDTGDPAAGTGLARPGTGTDITGGTASRLPDRSTAPWRSDQWPADRAAALQAVQDGRVPDQYRDVVRAYFGEPK